MGWVRVWVWGGQQVWMRVWVLLGRYSKQMSPDLFSHSLISLLLSLGFGISTVNRLVGEGLAFRDCHFFTKRQSHACIQFAKTDQLLCGVSLVSRLFEF